MRGTTAAWSWQPLSLTGHRSSYPGTHISAQPSPNNPTGKAERESRHSDRSEEPWLTGQPFSHTPVPLKDSMKKALGHQRKQTEDYREEWLGQVTGPRSESSDPNGQITLRGTVLEPTSWQAVGGGCSFSQPSGPAGSWPGPPLVCW